MSRQFLLKWREWYVNRKIRGSKFEELFLEDLKIKIDIFRETKKYLTRNNITLW